MAPRDEIKLSFAEVVKLSKTSAGSCEQCRGILVDAAADLLKVFTYAELLVGAEFDTSPTTLYRLRGDAGLLYVGIAGNPGRRFEQHKKRLWWGDVVSVDLEHFPTRDSALRAESEAIRREHPIYNKDHNHKETHIDDLRRDPRTPCPPDRHR